MPELQLTAPPAEAASPGNLGASLLDRPRDHVRPRLASATVGLRQEDVYSQLLAELEPWARELLELALAGRGRFVLDKSGSRIGKVLSVLVDRETGGPQWLCVHLPHTRRDVLVGLPTAGLSNSGGLLWTPLDTADVRNAPIIHPDFVSARIEQALCRHYSMAPTRGAGQGRWERRATGAQAFRDPAAPGTIRWLPAPRGSRV